MRRVLFVDDDPQLLEGLRIRLRRMREAWEMEFVNSGREAIDVMERRPFDVIVSDQRMPEMDGATLLDIVRERWPRTVRIVLSGYAELEQTVRLVPVAHQYISKPCDPAQLESSISRCLALQELLGQPALRELVGQLGRLPPAPTTYVRLQAAMASETSSVADIAGIIASDTIVTGKLLQMVNSGFFRLPRRVKGVEQAVGYLGLNTVRSLVVSVEVFSAWTAAPRLISLEKLQKHASEVAAAALAILPPSQLADDTLLAALLHDIGYWVLTPGRERELAEAQRIATAEALPMDQAEKRVLGASHAEIGAYLLGIWGLPSSIVEAVAHHHTPHAVPGGQFDAVAALCIAHALVETGECAAFSGASIPRSEISSDYLAAVRAPFTWEEASRRVSAALSGGAHSE
jgi:putative nucleotidyltransferase with HDIG domain